MPGVVPQSPFPASFPFLSICFSAASVPLPSKYFLPRGNKTWAKGINLRPPLPDGAWGDRSCSIQTWPGWAPGRMQDRHGPAIRDLGPSQNLGRVTWNGIPVRARSRSGGWFPPTAEPCVRIPPAGCWGAFVRWRRIKLDGGKQYNAMETGAFLGQWGTKQEDQGRKWKIMERKLSH